MIQGLHSSLAKLAAQFTVSIQWVPAHVGLTGNEKAVYIYVCWLLNVPATCECISGTDLLRQFYVLPH